MKRLLLAGLLVLFALSRARADRYDAYGSLMGMADSAASDKGPQAGAAGPAGSIAPSAPKTDAAAPNGEVLRDAIASPATAAPVTVTVTAVTPGRTAKRKTPQEGAVAVPAVSAPRVWTKFFASLIPARTPAASFDVHVATRPATAASAAGSAQGLLELISTSTAL